MLDFPVCEFLLSFSAVDAAVGKENLGKVASGKGWPWKQGRYLLLRRRMQCRNTGVLSLVLKQETTAQ